MCTCDLVDPSVFEAIHRKAKKQHKCDECSAVIEPGTIYNRIFGVWDGDCRTYKQCLNCQAIGDRFREEDDCGYGIGELYEWLRESDYLNFDEESQRWESGVDWLCVVSQEPLRCEVVA